MLVSAPGRCNVDLGGRTSGLPKGDSCGPEKTVLGVGWMAWEPSQRSCAVSEILAHLITGSRQGTSLLCVPAGSYQAA